MRIAVTGGTSFIGSHVAEGMLALGHELLLLDDPSSRAPRDLPAGATRSSLDLRDASELARVLRAFRPDAVCHAVRHEAKHVGAALDASVRSGAQSFILASNDALEPERDLPGCEHARHLRAVTLRYGNVYGPGQDQEREPGVVGTFIARMLRHEPIQINARSRRGDDGCVRDYVFVDDLVRATIAALDPRFAHRTMDVCTGRPITTRALAEHIRRACGSHSSICHASRRAGDAVWSRPVLDPTHCRALYQPTGLIAGLTKTIAWFEARAWRSEAVSGRIARPEALAGGLRSAPGTAA